MHNDRYFKLLKLAWYGNHPETLDEALEVLELTRQDLNNLNKIKTQYRKMAAKYHPDIISGKYSPNPVPESEKKIAHEMLQKLSISHKILEEYQTNPSMVNEKLRRAKENQASSEEAQPSANEVSSLDDALRQFEMTMEELKPMRQIIKITELTRRLAHLQKKYKTVPQKLRNIGFAWHILRDFLFTSSPDTISDALERLSLDKKDLNLKKLKNRFEELDRKNWGADTRTIREILKISYETLKNLLESQQSTSAGPEPSPEPSKEEESSETVPSPFNLGDLVIVKRKDGLRSLGLVIELNPKETEKQIKINVWAQEKNQRGNVTTKFENVVLASQEQFGYVKIPVDQTYRWQAVKIENFDKAKEGNIKVSWFEKKFENLKIINTKVTKDISCFEIYFG